VLHHIAFNSEGGDRNYFVVVLTINRPRVKVVSLG